MKQPEKNRPVFIKRPLTIALIVLGLLILIVLGLEKANVINLYSQNTPQTVQQPTSTIDYSPATEAEMPDESIKQQDTGTHTESPTQNVGEAIAITLSAAGQDYKGGPVVIRTLLSNANGGTCTATLVKGSASKTYTSDINWQGNYYSCEGFNVPYADLSAGTWELTVRADQGANTGSISQQITVEAN